MALPPGLGRYGSRYGVGHKCPCSLFCKCAQRSNDGKNNRASLLLLALLFSFESTNKKSRHRKPLQDSLAGLFQAGGIEPTLRRSAHVVGSSYAF